MKGRTVSGDVEKDTILPHGPKVVGTDAGHGVEQINLKPMIDLAPFIVGHSRDQAIVPNGHGLSVNTGPETL
jgi:hypothetical protein